jgi:hypothetical protein
LGEVLSYKLIVLYVLLGFIMVQYQNCAPGQNFDQNFELADGLSHGVDAINPIRIGEISFVQEKLSLADREETVEARGLCEQSGSIISWQLVDDQGAAIDRGLSECDQGIFVVSLGEGWKSFCDETFVLEAKLGAKASSRMLVEALCNP